MKTKSKFVPERLKISVKILICSFLILLMPGVNVGAINSTCIHPETETEMVSSKTGIEYSYSASSYCYSNMEYVVYRCNKCKAEWQHNTNVATVPHNWKTTKSAGTKACGTKYTITREECVTCNVVKSEREEEIAPSHVWGELLKDIDGSHAIYVKMCLRCGAVAESK